MNNKPLICVDFDGVLNTYEGWRGPNVLYTPRPGAREFLTQLQSKFTVAIFSTRDSDRLREWFELYHMPYDKIVTKKVPAVAYIDDRALRFDGNYDKLLYELKHFKAHWEKDYDAEGYLHGEIDEHNQYNLAYETNTGWWAVECGGLTLWKEEVVYILNELHNQNIEYHEKVEKTLQDCYKLVNHSLLVGATPRSGKVSGQLVQQGQLMLLREIADKLGVDLE